MKRPTTDGHRAIVTTPRVAEMMKLLGSGARHNDVVLSRDEFRAVNKLYGFQKEPPNMKPPPPEPPVREDYPDRWAFDRAIRDHGHALQAHANWEDPRELMQAGADRNAFRHAEADGLRMLAWIAKYVPAGEDPLKHLVQAALAAGWDVDPADIQWMEEEP